MGKCLLFVVLPAGIVQRTALLRCVLETVHDAAVGGYGLWQCFIPPPCTSRVGEGIRIHVTGRRSARAASILPYLLSC